MVRKSEIRQFYLFEALGKNSRLSIYGESGVVTRAMKNGVQRPEQNFYRFGAMGIFNHHGTHLAQNSSKRRRHETEF